MSDDQDVILKNSPLDQYLSEIGFGDFDTYQADCATQDLEPSVSNSGSGHTCTVDSVVTVSQKLYAFLPVSSSSADKTDLLRSCQVILQSTLLNEDDSANLNEISAAVQQELNSTALKHGQYISLLTRNQLYFMFSIVALSVSVILPLTLELNSFLLHYGLVGSLLLTFGILLILLCSKIWRSELSKQTLEAVSKFEEAAGTLMKLVDRSVVLIKEVEVVSMGFMQYSPSMPLESLDFRVRSQKCLRLRQMVWKFLSHLYEMQKNDTQALLAMDTDVKYDYKEEYIAHVSRQMIAPLLTLEATKTSNEDQYVYIALSKLKSLVCLMRIQQSELTYQLIVHLLHIYQTEVDSYSSVLQKFMSLLEDEVSYLRGSCERLSEQLSATTKYAFNREQPYRSRSRQNINGNKHEQALHMSDLHLQAATSHIQQLQRLLSAEVVNSSEIQKAVKCFNISIENAKCCVTDACNAHAVNLAIQSSLPMQPGTLPGSAGPVGSDLINSANTHVNERELGDLLFEGDSDPIECQKADSGIGVEEREKLNRDYAESKKLMKELKAILSVKTSPEGLLSFPLHKPDSSDFQKEPTKTAEPRRLSETSNTDVTDGGPSQHEDDVFEHGEGKNSTAMNSKDEIDKQCYLYDSKTETCSEVEDSSNLEDEFNRFSLPAGFAQALQLKLGARFVEPTFEEVGEMSDPEQNEFEDE